MIDFRLAKDTTKVQTVGTGVVERASYSHARDGTPPPPFASMASDGSLSERERLVYSAKLAEQAERYDGERDCRLSFRQRGLSFGIPFFDHPSAP